MKPVIVIGVNMNSENVGAMIDAIDEAATDFFGYGAIRLDFEYANLLHDEATLVECDGADRADVEAVIDGALSAL